eukprot:g5890.t1
MVASRRIGRGWILPGALLLRVLLSPVLVLAQQCQEAWTVDSTTTANEVYEALLTAECEGETVVVDWIGRVIVENAITVKGGTSVAVSGNSSGAAADGNGSTPLFTVESATLNIENMVLANGYSEGGRGGAIFASGSEVHISGTTVFEGNMCSSPDDAATGGGAVRVEGSNLTWTGFTTFVNNTALVYDGGALSCSEESICTGTGTTVFKANSGAQDGGAVRVAHSDLHFVGDTSFIDNFASRMGGALLAADDAAVNFSGTTNATGNSAATGGAFNLAGDSLIATNLTFGGKTVIANNTALEGDGGGMAVTQGCRVFFDDAVTFVDNIAGDDGGGLSIDGDSLLRFSGNTLFSGNSAGSKGGAVYANGNVDGLTYDGAVFESNSAAIGGAIASYSGEDSLPNSYIGCTFNSNNATSTGGAIEISVGQEYISDSTFINNLAGSGGALRLSGDVSISNVVFEGNKASSLGIDGTIADAGPAVSNLGRISAMTDVRFKDNTLFCREGTFMDYKDPDETATRFSTVCAGCNDSSTDPCSTCQVDGDMRVPAGCFDSPDGTDDVQGTKLETLEILPGWYRATNETTNIFQCYNEDACLGGQTGDEDFCADGYTGHYCAVCEPGFSATLGSTCSPCSGLRYSVVLTSTIVLLFALALVVLIGAIHLVSTEPEESFLCRNHLCRCCKHVGKKNRSLLASFKIVIVVWQIVTQFSDVANVAWPGPFEWFLRLVDVINLDVGFVLSAGCVWTGFDFHDRLLLVTLWPLVALAMLWASYRFAKARIEADKTRPSSSPTSSAATPSLADPAATARSSEAGNNPAGEPASLQGAASAGGAEDDVKTDEEKGEGETGFGGEAEKGSAGAAAETAARGLAGGEKAALEKARWGQGGHLPREPRPTATDGPQRRKPPRTAQPAENPAEDKIGKGPEEKSERKVDVPCDGDGTDDDPSGRDAPPNPAQGGAGAKEPEKQDNGTRSVGPSGLRRVKNSHISAALFLTFLVYSTVSSTLFQAFACDDELDDGGDYLRADYRIQCTSTKHRLFMVYSALMMLVYPFGIPYVYARLLSRSFTVEKNSGKWHRPPTDVKDDIWFEVKPLWESYNCERWYYEVIECVRRIMLTGVVVFIYPGDAAQIAWTIAITFVFFVVFGVMSPYPSSLNTWLAGSGHIVVLTAFYIALIGKLDVSGEREASQAGLGAMLIVLHVEL